jgi:hypothetical protein
LPEWLLNIDEMPAEDIVAVLLEIEARPEYARRKVERAMDFVHRRAQETMETIGAIV